MAHARSEWRTGARSGAGWNASSDPRCQWMRKFAGVSSKLDGFDPTPLLKTMDTPSDETAKLKVRIKQLEEELKISQLKGKAYQIMVEIAKQDYGIDLEKKHGAKQSKDSK